MAPSKILVIKLRALGDTVLATAPILELYRTYPQSEIQILAPKAWSPLFEGLPGVRKIWTYERRSFTMARARAITRLAYSLRNEKFDLVINLHASPTSSLLAFSTGAKVRSIHFHGHHHRNRYSTVTIPGKGTLKPNIERDMDALRALQIHIPAGRLPVVRLQTSETQIAAEYLRKLQLKGPILGMSLGASRPTKQWPIERFAALAVEWCKKETGSVVILTGENEDQLQKKFLESLDEILTASEPKNEVRSTIRKQIAGIQVLPLRKFAAVLSQLSVWVGSDSGPKHLAISVGTPTVTLFGPEHPFEWHPYPTDRNPYLFVNDLPCRKDADPGMPPWCGLKTCIQEENRCMRLIGIDSVFEGCKKVSKRRTDV